MLQCWYQRHCDIPLDISQPLIYTSPLRQFSLRDLEELALFALYLALGSSAWYRTHCCVTELHSVSSGEKHERERETQYPAL